MNCMYTQKHTENKRSFSMWSTMFNAPTVLHFRCVYALYWRRPDFICTRSKCSTIFKRRKRNMSWILYCHVQLTFIFLGLSFNRIWHTGHPWTKRIAWKATVLFKSDNVVWNQGLWDHGVIFLYEQQKRNCDCKFSSLYHHVRILCHAQCLGIDSKALNFQQDG